MVIPVIGNDDQTNVYLEKTWILTEAKSWGTTIKSEVASSRDVIARRPRSARADFLAQFELDVYPHIIEFARRISDCDADVLVFTARKAACLFDAMRAVGLVTTEAQVVSNRVLDMKLDWVIGLRVAVVDDLIVTGSTLYQDSERLRLAGAASVEVIALAVAVDTWQRELVAPLPGHMELPLSRGLHLCSQIVDAISVVPRPYNLDWPLFDGVRLSGSLLSTLVGMIGWTTIETTSTSQHAAQVHTLTMTPTASTRRRLEAEIGLGLGSAFLLKVRVYARVSASGDGSLDLRVLPIVGFEDLLVRDVDSLFDLIVATGGEREYSQSFETASSRLRLVQFVLAARLGHVWLDQLSGITGRRDERSLEHNQLSFAFAPAEVRAVRRLSGRRDLYPPLALTHVESAPVINEPTSHVAESTWDMQYQLTLPFRQMYINRELLARQKLLELGRSAYDDAELRPMLDRLYRGHGLRELEQLASTLVGSSSGGSSLLSEFLDIAVDHGVAVPITMLSDDETVIYRGYRHGEDIVFAENELRLFGLMLDSAFSALGSDRMPRLTAEKLCVIFVRIGVQKGILNRWHGRLGAPGSVGIRADRFGAVVQSDSSTMFGSNPGNGLGKILERSGTLRSVAGGYAMAQIVGDAATGRIQEGEAARVGHMLGTLLRQGQRGGKGLRGRTDLVYLATCSTAFMTTAGLAAEVELVSQGLSALDLRVRTASGSSARALAAEIDRSDAAEALKNGIGKFDAYRQGVPRIIIDRVAKEMPDTVWRSEWQSWWDEPVGPDMTVTPQLVELIHKQGRWLLEMTSLIGILRAVLCIRGGGNDAEVTKHLNMAVVETTAIQRIAGPGHPLAALVLSARDAWRESRLDIDDLLQKIRAGVAGLLRNAHPLLDRVRATANVWGHPRTLITYTAGVCVVADGPGEDVSEFLVALEERAIRLQGGASKRSGNYIVQFNDVARDSAVFISSGSRASQLVRDLAIAAIQLASASVTVRVLLLPDLSEDERVFSGDVSGTLHGTRFLQHIADMTSTAEFTSPGASRVMQSTERLPGSRTNTTTALHDALAGRVRSLSTVQHGNKELVVISIEPVAGAPTDRADIGIVTIIHEEAAAVREWLQGEPSFRRTRVNSRYFYQAEPLIDGVSRRVVMTQAISQGDVSAYAAHKDLEQFAAPRFSVLLGVAGGIHKDVGLGDVVLATSITDYGPVAITPEGPRHRGEQWQLPAHMRACLNDYFSGGSNPRRLVAGPRARSLHQAEFSLVEGPIGTGPAVVKFRDAEARQWLHAVNDKILVLETESAGSAAHYHAEFERQQIKGYLVIRGLSDHADHNKDDMWKEAASQNATLALRELIPSILEGLNVD